MEQDGAGTDQAEAEAVVKNPAGALLVAFSGIDPYSRADPDFIGVDRQILGVRLHSFDLPLQLLFVPVVVAVQECDPVVSGGSNPSVAGGTDTTVLLPDAADPIADQGLEYLVSSVG